MLFYWHYCLLTNIKGMFCNAYYICLCFNERSYLYIQFTYNCFECFRHSGAISLAVLSVAQPLTRLETHFTVKITCICISLPSLYHRKQTRRIINERGVLCLSWTGCLAQTVGKDAGCRFVLEAELRWAKQHNRRNALPKAKPRDKIQGLCHEFLYTFGCLLSYILSSEGGKTGRNRKKIRRWNNLMWL